MIAAAALAACGGGGGGDTSPATLPTLESPFPGTPTAAIAASNGAAVAAVDAVKTVAPSVVKVFTFTGLPLGVNIALPGGVVTNAPRACLPSGSVTDVVDSGSDNALSPGDTWTTTYTACASSSGNVISGTFARTYTAYTSDTDYTYTLKASGVTGKVAGTDFGPYAFDATNTVKASAGDIRYLVDGHWVVGQPVGDRTGSTVTLREATVRAAQGSGFVEMVFAAWAYDATTGRPVAGDGSVVLTGAGGNRATVKAGANGYDVSIVAGGAAAQSFSVPY